MSARTRIVFSCATLLIAAAALFAETPKEAVGFWGTVTGTVKSAKADGASFVLTVVSATPSEQSAIKDGAPMVGKNLTLGTRMPKVDGKGTPNAEDVAYIKTLKPGDNITVSIFAARFDPSVLRIQAPGQPAATQPTDGDKTDHDKN